MEWEEYKHFISPDSNHELIVRAVDIAGNISETRFTFETEYNKLRGTVRAAELAEVTKDEADIQKTKDKVAKLKEGPDKKP